MGKQLSLDLGRQFQATKTHKSGPYTASYKPGDTHADITHNSDPKDVIDRIPLGKAPAKALKDWHANLKNNYR